MVIYHGGFKWLTMAYHGLPWSIRKFLWRPKLPEELLPDAARAKVFTNFPVRLVPYEPYHIHIDLFNESADHGLMNGLFRNFAHGMCHLDLDVDL